MQKQARGSATRSLNFLKGSVLPRQSANRKRSRSRGVNELSQWASSVVKKATPKIAQSLIEAAELLGQPAQLSSGKSSQAPAEEEDESLAAMLLRLLRTPDTGENSRAQNNAGSPAACGSENPSVG